MRIQKAITPLLILTILIQSAVVFGQSADDWGQVSRLSIGTRVRVEPKAGRKIEGTIQTVDDSGIGLSVNGATQRVAAPDVRRLYLIEKGSAGKSAAIGAAVGAAAGGGVGAGALAATGGSDDTAGVLAPFILVGAGVGALIGGVLGRKKAVLIYEAR